jgi:hypothetical protein
MIICPKVWTAPVFRGDPARAPSRSFARTGNSCVLLGFTSGVDAMAQLHTDFNLDGIQILLDQRVHRARTYTLHKGALGLGNDCFVDIWDDPSRRHQIAPPPII